MNGKMGLDYDELRKIYRFEKNNSRLAEVDGNFFDSLTDFFEKQKKDYLHSLHDLSSSKARYFNRRLHHLYKNDTMSYMCHAYH